MCLFYESQEQLPTDTVDRDEHFPILESLIFQFCNHHLTLFGNRTIYACRY
jgi:hypothetical protein